MNTSTPPNAPAPLKLWQAGLGVLAFLVLVASFNGLASLLNLTEPWAGALWLLCWAGFDEHRPARLLPNVLGAAAGLTLGWLLRWAPQQFGTAGMVLCAVPILFALTWTLLRGAQGPVINNTLWLYVTVVTVPWIHRPVAFPQLYAGMAAGAIFFGGVLMIGPWLAARGASRALATQASNA
jgi:hypothetical protein